jgi:hypothetical protein
VIYVSETSAAHAKIKMKIVMLVQLQMDKFSIAPIVLMDIQRMVWAATVVTSKHRIVNQVLRFALEIPAKHVQACLRNA